MRSPTGAWELAREDRVRRVLIAVLVVALVACGVRTVVRNRDWASDDTLRRSTVAAAPDSAKAQKGYAAAVFARGGADNLSLAIVHAERAVAIRPDYVEALLDLGGYHVARGDQLTSAQQPADARQAFDRAVALLRRGRRLDRRGQHDFQRQMMAHGLSRSSVPERGSAPLYRNLALAYFGVADLERAVIANHYARRLDPWAVQTYLDVSALQARRGRWDAAAITLFEVVALDRGTATRGRD